MGSQTHEAVTGSSATVGGVLVSSTAGVGVLITDPLTTQPSHTGYGPTLTRTNGMGTSLTISTANGTDTGHVTISISALHGFTLTGTTGAEAFDGDFLTSGVQVGGDSGEVGDGSVHQVCFFRPL